MKDLNRSSSEFSSSLQHFITIIIYISCVVVLLSLILCLLAYFKIGSFAFNTYDNYDEVPHYKVGLLLGTAPNAKPGLPNEFFTNRIMAAATLYHKGKIDYILVSGDNRHRSYNEPIQMYNALIKHDIPKDHIILDYAGFSTIDSIIRARKVFLLDNVLIISQQFHNERALFIASYNNLNAKAFNAADPISDVARFKVNIREIFARIKCILDVYILNSQPKFLGDPIPIGGASLPKQPSNTPKSPTSMPKHPSLSVYGLKYLNLDTIRTTAKQPSDAALILKQQENALKVLELKQKEDEL